MLHSLFILRRHRSHLQHLLSSFSLIIPTTTHRHHFTTTQNSRVDFVNVDCHGFPQSVLSSELSLLENPHSNAYLKTNLLEVSTVDSEITRRFWNVPLLKPQHVMQVLLGCQSQVGVRIEKVQSLWEIFKWVGEKNIGFGHLLQSYEFMVSLLVQAGMLLEAENLLFALERKGVLLGSREIFDNLIEGYVGVKELERAIFVYDSMRGRGMVPSRSCFHVLLDHLGKMKRTKLALRVALDFLELGAPLIGAEMVKLENVMILFCINGKIQEAISMVRKVLTLISEVSSMIFDEIAFGCCEKKDFKDLISFFVEVKCAPTVMAANRVINSLCSSHGVERAGMFLQELDSIGFSPDEVTYGILIGWSCHEGKMKNSLSYLLVMLSKSFVPHRYTYNALISGLFKVGMLEHASDILDEMIDRGITPDISTFRVLIAGYCKSRRF